MRQSYWHEFDPSHHTEDVQYQSIHMPPNAPTSPVAHMAEICHLCS